jgi:hypothetical protein
MSSSANDWQALLWDCPNCGNTNIQGDLCPTCGTFKDQVKGGGKRSKKSEGNSGFQPMSATPSYEPPINTDSFTKPPPPDLAGLSGVKGASDRLFLLNRGHENFVAGFSRRLAINWTFPVIVIILGLVSAFLFAIGYQPYVNYVQLNQNGKTITGTVTDKRTSVSSGRNRSTTYYIKYQYIAEDRSFTREQSVTSSIYNRYVKGARITVVYLPDSPQVSLLSGDAAYNDGTLITIGIWAIETIVILILIFFWVRHMLRNQYLTQKGQIIEGRVVGSSITRSKSTYTLKMKYEFISPTSGKKITRSESRVRNDLKQSGAPNWGRLVAVLYADDHTYRVL